MSKKLRRLDCVLQVVGELSSVIMSALHGIHTDFAMLQACSHVGSSIVSVVKLQACLHDTLRSQHRGCSTQQPKQYERHHFGTQQPKQYETHSRDISTADLLSAASSFASLLALIDATVVSKNLRPACSAVPRLSSLKPG